MKKKELKYRLCFLLISIIFLRIGSFIPIPSININNFNKIINYNNNNFIELLNIYSGGALLHASIFTLGLIPYISSSIFIQTLNILNKKILNIKKNDINSNFIINKYIKYTALILSIIQSIIITSVLLNSFNTSELILCNNLFVTYFINTISLVTGTMFLIWLGDQITKYSFENGISIIICINILSKLPYCFFNIINQIKLNNITIFEFIIFNIITIFIILLIIIIENSNKKIIVEYLNNNYNKIKKNIYLSFKINISGIMPAIFSSSLMFIIKLLILRYHNFIISSLNNDNTFLLLCQILNLLLYIFVIIVFCFTYNNIIFEDMEISKYLKKSDIIIPGIMPGLKTKKFLYKIIKKLTFISSIYISIICLIPELIKYFTKLPFYLNGISLLIIIITIMECIKQIETIKLNNEYNYKKNIFLN
ncbi:preprotein translocase subunit SecY [Candidatus Annandia pinicola]|uniref:preprotein translocase subunit SecY n=1 Tax=Candidatus Annandia pinicola TaxID=1345117 RepID=UPI001D02982D|nr:preprotein translocase subunit SecY [Candidatus Annandia pinicola]UDG80481.1 Protein translocase subunit SecY [Candidatus Annandia pinicola]